MLYDHRQLIGIGWIVGHAIGYRVSQNMTVTVLMLQTFTVKCGSTGRTANQESTRLQITSGPTQIAHPLKTKHRVIDIKRDQWIVIDTVGGCYCQPG